MHHMDVGPRARVPRPGDGIAVEGSWANVAPHSARSNRRGASSAHEARGGTRRGRSPAAAGSANRASEKFAPPRHDDEGVLTGWKRSASRPAAFCGMNFVLAAMNPLDGIKLGTVRLERLLASERRASGRSRMRQLLNRRRSESNPAGSTLPRSGSHQGLAFPKRPTGTPRTREVRNDPGTGQGI